MKTLHFSQKNVYFDNKTKFVSLKRILPILSFILLATLCSHGQTSAPPEAGIVRFYPNPATSYITFDPDKNADKGYMLEVFSFLGRKMYETPNLTQRTTINLTDYTRGVYVYQIHDKNGKMLESGKFQVSK